MFLQVAAAVAAAALSSTGSTYLGTFTRDVNSDDFLVAVVDSSTNTITKSHKLNHALFGSPSPGALLLLALSRRLALSLSPRLLLLFPPRILLQPLQSPFLGTSYKYAAHAPLHQARVLLSLLSLLSLSSSSFPFCSRLLLLPPVLSYMPSH